jgi:hypothetical protein
MSIFWIIFPLSWATYAAFVGLTVFLVIRLRELCLAPFVAISVLIVALTSIFLVDQNAFQSGAPIYLANMAALALFTVAWFVSHNLPKPVAGFSRSISSLAFAVAVL